MLGAVLTRVHFERWRARALGWRGVRPVMDRGRAWTCRVAHSEHVLGVVFQGPEVCPETMRAGANATVWGRFALFVFPPATSDVLERFPLRALSVAVRDDYATLVRGLNFAAGDMESFCLGTLHMGVRIDGKGVTLLFDTPARWRTVALDGVRAPDAGGESAWIIPPGGFEADVQPLRLLLPFMTSLAASVELVFDAPLTIRRWVRGEAMRGFDARGQEFELQADRLPILSLLCREKQSQHADAKRLLVHHVYTAVQVGEACATPPGAPVIVRACSRLPLFVVSDTRVAPRPLLHMLTGFLGSGKTTFLREWLDYLHGRERFTGVIQNEFGQVGLDATLLRDDTYVEALDEGCVCCSLADSLRPGIQRLLAAMPGEELILETSGLANPANVREALSHLGDLVRPGLVVTVVDALDLARFIPETSGSVQRESAAQAEPHAWILPLTGVARAQISEATVLVLNKTDMVPASVGTALREALKRFNPHAVLLSAAWGRIPFALLDHLVDEHAGNMLHPAAPSRGLAPFARALTHKDEGYTSYLTPMPDPVTLEEIDCLARASGAVRVKGIVRLAVNGEKQERLNIVQYAAQQLRIEPLPEDFESPAYLVYIGQNLKKD